MKLILDTHVLLWWHLDAKELPPTYAERLEEAEEKNSGYSISVITLWEIAKIVSLGKLRVSFSLDSWFEDLYADSLLTIFPLTSQVILESTRLRDRFHKDPADQLIVATARCHGLHLLTADTRIRESGVVSVL